MSPPFGSFFRRAKAGINTSEPVPGMFWRGTSDVGIVKDGADLMETWGDRSAYVNDVVRIGSGLVGPPKWFANIFGTRPGILMQEASSGADAFMACSTPTGGIPAPADGSTVYTVCRPTSAVGGNIFSIPFQAGRSAIDQMFLYLGVQYGWSDGEGVAAPFAAPVDYTGQDLLIAHYNDGATITVKVNNVVRAVVPNVVTAPAANSGFVVGGWMPAGNVRSGCNAYFAEQIAYDPAVVAMDSPEDIRNVLYFSQAWGV